MMNKLKLSIILIILLLPSIVWAACSGSSPNLTAASSSQTDVAACVTASITGDTINVPAGTSTWSSAISIPAAKDLTIIGAGIGNTNITCSSGSCFQIAQSGSSSESRISGFSFINGIIDLTGLQGGKVVRIDHNSFTASSLATWDIAGWTDGVHPSVLIDSNILHNQRFVIHGTWGELTDGPWQHQIWAQQPPKGSWPNIVYIESNTITADISPINMPDSARGGRFVFRFNTIQGIYTEAHGVQGNVRSVQWWEIYNNEYANTGQYFFMFIRGGSGFIFDNTYALDREISFNIQRSCESVATAGQCNGESNWDGNTVDEYGYPCRDQIGRSYDTTQWSPGEAYSQPLTPAYIFNNKYSAAEIDLEFHQDPYCAEAETYHAIENRDYYLLDGSFDGTTGIGRGVLASIPATCTTGVGYWATDQGNWNQSGDDGVLYKCTSTDTWEVYYTPYAYPHPLRGEGEPEPTPHLSVPGNLTGTIQ